MQIGVVTTSFPQGPGDHAGRFVLELSRALAHRGHELEVVAPDPGAGSPPKWCGVDVYWARYALPRRAQQLCYQAGIPDNVRRRPWLALQAPALVAGLEREVRRRCDRWDGVISHWLVPSGLVAGRTRAGMPHVALAHSGDIWLLNRLPLRSIMVSQIANGSTAVAAVNPALACQLQALALPRHIEPTVLPMGPGQGDRQPTARPEDRQLLERLSEKNPSLASASLVVGVVARLVPVKGVDVLLQALAVPEARGIAAIIAGDGPMRSKLEAMARDQGAAAAFVGTVDGGQRAALLDQIDVLAVPSLILPNGRTEGTPVAAVEGLAAGLPVVASDVGGLSWALGDAALMVEPASPTELARALGRLRDDETLRIRLGRNALRRSGSFGWDGAAATLEGLLFSGAAGG